MRLGNAASLACVLGLGIVVSVPAQAEMFDAAIGEETLRVGLTGPLSRLFALDKGEYDLGLVAGDIEDFKQEDFLSGHVGALLSGDAGASGASVVAGLGVRLQYVKADSENGGALAIGGQLRVKLLQANRLRFNAAVWHGPDASSFGDFDQFTEASASIGYEVLRDAELYVGYRLINVGIDEGGDVDLEDSAHIGIRLDF